MKIFAAGIATESNTFAPGPTGLEAYRQNGIHRGSESPVNAYSPMFDTLRRLAREEGHELVIGLGAYAAPGGITVRAAYEALRDELLSNLRAAMPVDAVVLPLHGAMVADGYDSCESDLVAHVRGIVGRRVPIGVELDLHCHFTETLHRAADIVIAYKEYPHTDIAERLEEVWRLTLATVEGRIEPVTAVFDCRMSALWRTTEEPMRSFVRRLHAQEGHDGVLSVSFGHGFEYGDVPDAGAKVWVIGDGRIDRGGKLVAEMARRLGLEIFAMREAARVPLLTLDRALDALQSAPAGAPLVLADTADNPGGGAAGDSTFILRGLIERGIGNVAIGAFRDLGAVHICRDVGVGATLKLRIGGKCGPASGAPVDLEVIVRAVCEQHVQTALGARHSMGPSVWVSTANGLHIVLCSERIQAMGSDLFTGLGMALPGLRGIVVKSAQHFHASFAPLASQVLYVETPGLMRSDFENIPYRRRSLNYWPRVADPWAAGA
jgi:microcystin degradation protein MlrC